jgi:hypothetical protein
MKIEALTAERIERVHRQFIADRLSREIGCEVTLHPMLRNVFEAWKPLPGVWLMAGSAAEIKAEVYKYYLDGSS